MVWFEYAVVFKEYLNATMHAVSIFDSAIISEHIIMYWYGTHIFSSSVFAMK